MNLTRHNYEEYFLLYVDGELAVGERLAVEAFLQEHPDLVEEMDDLQRTILPADEVYTFDKTLVYQYTRAEAPAKVIPFGRKRLSVAAAVAIALLTSGALWIIRERNHDQGGTPAIAALSPSGSASSGTGASGTGASGTASAQTGASGETLPSGTTPGNAGAGTTPGSTAAGTTPTPGGAAVGATPGNPTQTAAKPGDTSPSSATGTPNGALASGSAAGSSIVGRDGTSHNPEAAPLPALHATAPTDLAATSTGVPANPVAHNPQPATLHPDTADANNNSFAVTRATPATYHTIEEGDQGADGDKILFVRADQVVNGEVKGFFRRAGRLLKRSTSLNTDNVRLDSDR